MKWYHFSVEYFEDLRNVNHCEFLIMRQKEDSGKYILENKLRTWSELKRERLAAVAAKDKSTTLSILTEKEKDKERKLLGGVEPQVVSASSVPVRKKWGGCPMGCDHSKHHYHKKGDNSMHAMDLNINGKAPSPTTQHMDTLPFRRPPAARRWQSSSEEDEDDPRGRIGPPPAVDIQLSLDEMVSSPDGTPSFISVDDRLRMKSPKADILLVKNAGRDFGGSASGNTSRAGSDTEFSPVEEKLKTTRVGRKKSAAGMNGISTSRQKGGREESGMGRGAMADALGDQSDVDSTASPADLDGEQKLAGKEKEEEDIGGVGSVN